MMEYNINYEVLVKLTDCGRKALARQHVEFWAQAGRPAPYDYRPPDEDKDGWSKWQMWRLMADLGHLCCMGSTLPFETNIRLVGDPFALNDRLCA